MKIRLHYYVEKSKRRTMKVMFLIRSLEYGGAQRQLAVLAKELFVRGVSVAVAEFYSGGELEKNLDNEGIPIHRLNKRGRWDLARFTWRFIKLLRQKKPDIVYGYLTTANIMITILKPFFPRIKVVWGVRASHMDLDRYDWLFRFSYKIECKLSRFADVIIANSIAGKVYAIEHGFPANKLNVIPNGIDTTVFQPDWEAGRRVRAEWGVTDKEKFIGLIGRLDPMKDHQTFLHAAALLAEEYQDVRFLCVGDGPTVYQQELKKMSIKLELKERIIWSESRTDMPAVYNSLDINCISSYGEGFPNVIGEAMACGVPCVVTDVGDSANIVGDSGVIVPPHSPESLFKGLKCVLEWSNEDYLLKSNKAREHIINNFSTVSLFEKSYEVLSTLI